ncbi:MAG: TIGR00730 family Rossman fold protein [Paludibacteraceae bacterium]|nr:TIGR00730 family Rossman fold protein [Paludibacteraceae bacterium]
MIKRVCVYCASSSQVDEKYKQAARRLGEILSEKGIGCNYGGGAIGLMGELAKSMVKHQGDITGIIPHFMVERGWDNPAVVEVETDSMHTRKERMVQNVDAAIALPGGCGTLEELMEIITWKQLGLFLKPIIILNADHFFDPLLAMLDKCVEENFMSEQLKKTWTVVNTAEEVIPAIQNAYGWEENDSHKYASL